MGVSPVRTAVRIGARSIPCSRASLATPASGISRFLCTSLLSAFSGETYRMSTCDRNLAGARLADEAVDRHEKCRQRFTRAGGRGDEHIAPGLDLGPAETLRLGEILESFAEPLFDEGIEGNAGEHLFTFYLCRLTRSMLSRLNCLIEHNGTRRLCVDGTGILDDWPLLNSIARM